MQVLAIRCCVSVVPVLERKTVKVLKKGYSALLRASGVG